jgi:hypothetical protein
MSTLADSIEQEAEKDHQPFKIINPNGRFPQHPGRR